MPTTERSASYEFNLYDHLQDEFCWYISVFCSRGFVIDYLEHLLRSWDMAIHSVIKPPEARELTRPLDVLHQHLNSLYQVCSIERGTMPAVIQPFMDHLLAKRRKDATEYILSLLSGGMSIEHLYADVLTASLTALGRLWQKNDINVVDVHCGNGHLPLCNDAAGGCATGNPITSPQGPDNLRAG